MTVENVHICYVCKNLLIFVLDLTKCAGIPFAVFFCRHGYNGYNLLEPFVPLCCLLFCVFLSKASLNGCEKSYTKRMYYYYNIVAQPNPPLQNHFICHTFEPGKLGKVLPNVIFYCWQKKILKY